MSNLVFLLRSSIAILAQIVDLNASRYMDISLQGENNFTFDSSLI